MYYSMYISMYFTNHYWLPRCPSGKEPNYQCKRCWFDPWVKKIPWRRKWQPTPVFVPGQRSLAGLQSMESERAGHD